jgi:flagellar hook-associated protein 2
MGSHSLEVQTLARAQTLKSEAFPATSATVGTGTLTISFGTYSGDNFALNADKATSNISIGAGQDSLAGIRDAINAANIGVTAGIVNDGTGYRLTVTSRDSGTANALRITVADDDATNSDAAGLSRLAFDGRSVSGVQNLTQTVGARDAVVVIDGIVITKPSNTITDALEGVTLKLLKENTPGVTTLGVSRDTSGVQSAVQSFVKAYNDLSKTIGGLTKYDAANKKASTLTGDSTVRSVQNRLRSLFNTTLATAGGGLRSLPEIGIMFQKDGTLALDSTRLSAVLSEPTKDLSTLFAAVGKPTDSLASFIGSTPNTKNGAYVLAVSQLGTQGTAIGSAAATLASVVAGINDTLSLTVDGVPASVTLAAGSYSATSLAAELQSKINGVTALSSAGIRVAVTQSAGVLSIASGQYGSASTVAITGGSGVPDLFGTPAETAGVDVAGSIGGFAATGSGQVLTGTGDTSGLALNVTGGATGTRGMVSFARGYAYELNQLVGKMLDNDSLIGGRITGINASIKDVERSNTALSQRMVGIEARYRAQFTALDSMMASMSKTSSFLTQQLATLPKAGALL